MKSIFNIFILLTLCFAANAQTITCYNVNNLETSRCYSKAVSNYTSCGTNKAIYGASGWDEMGTFNYVWAEYSRTLSYNIPSNVYTNNNFIDLSFAIKAGQCQGCITPSATLVVKLNGITYATFNNPSNSRNVSISTSSGAALISGFSLVATTGNLKSSGAANVTIRIPWNPNTRIYSLEFTHTPGFTGDDWGIGNVNLPACFKTTTTVTYSMNSDGTFTGSDGSSYTDLIALQAAVSGLTEVNCSSTLSEIISGLYTFDGTDWKLNGTTVVTDMRHILALNEAVLNGTIQTTDCPDNDNDGIPDDIDIDDDNDGILDVVEGTVDTDGDGIIDAFDVDSDNDGILDIEEGQPNGTLVTLSGNDHDNDGLDDNFDPDFNVNNNPSIPVDTDGDSTPDYLDLDSDDDGVLDLVEGQATGIIIYPSGNDTDNDGLDDNFDPDNMAGYIPNDADNDGVKNYRDLDSDNDGILDLVESQGSTTSYITPTGVDSDNDGIDDAFDFDFNSNNSPTNPTNKDNDIVPDYLDIDSDNDGILDVAESQGTTSPVVASGVDSDNDGIDDAFDPNSGKSTTNPIDTDNDGIPDQLDIDSDNDGIVDVIEGQTTASYTAPSGNDTDNDGLDDNFDPDNMNTSINAIDTDNDGIPDYLDTDSDNDGQTDIEEGSINGSTTLSGIDLDNDGLDDNFDDYLLTTGNVASTTNGGKVPNSYPDVQKVGGDRDWRESNQLCFSPKVFLQGGFYRPCANEFTDASRAFSSFPSMNASMSNGTESCPSILSPCNILPKSSPYNAPDTIGYLVNNYITDYPVTVDSLPANATDWVIVSVRNGRKKGGELMRRSAILLSDGSIVDEFGSSTFCVDFNAGDSLYVVIEHRNHLIVMQNEPMTVVQALPIDVDFRFNQGYQVGNVAKTSSMMVVGKYNGMDVYGMIGGDVDQNGDINSADINVLYLFNSLFQDYNGANLNINCDNNSEDFDMFFPNNSLFVAPELR